MQDLPPLPEEPSSPRPDGQPAVVEALESVLGRRWVLTGAATEPYVTGARLGHGKAVAVALPGTVAEAVAVLQACVDAGVAVIPQGRNTGLTGGSVPRDESGRTTVILSMRRLGRIETLDGGRLLLALGGAGIADAAAVAAAAGRESHSVLGSFFLNPTVGAGVALGSGGTQLRKGPVYTERLLCASVGADGRVRVSDTLGLSLSPSWPTALELLSAPPEAVPPLSLDPAADGRAAHDETYARRLCTLDSSVARCNADTRGPAALRSEGKVLVLASIHSTFPRPTHSETLWVSCGDFETAHAIRARCLRDPASLPSQLEYMDADSVDVVDRSGRALCLAIRAVGIGPRLRQLWDAKLWIEARPGCAHVVDWLLHCVNAILPSALPPPVAALSARYRHHLIVTLDSFDGDEEGAAKSAALRRDVIALAEAGGSGGHAHSCRADEAALVKTFRFAAAPAFRTYCVGTGAVAGLSFDYSLPKNFTGVPGVERSGSVISKRMRYSHFGCAVVHEDIAYSSLRGTPDEEKRAVKHVVEELGGRLPAEHGFGVEYAAPPAVRERWILVDPTNTMNPGVGRTSARPGYAPPPPKELR